MDLDLEALLFDMIQAGWLHHFAGPEDEGAIHEAHIPALRFLRNDADAERRIIAHIVRTFVDDSAILGGFGVSDVVRFSNWLDEEKAKLESATPPQESKP